MLSRILGRNKTKNDTKQIAFGTSGYGIFKVQGKGEFTRELRQSNVNLTPYVLVRPNIRPAEKNALIGIKRFRLSQDNLKQFFENEFKGVEIGTIDFATGGGTGSVAVLSAELAEEFVLHLVLRCYIDEHTFVDPSEEGRRKYLNSVIQFMLLREELERNLDVGLELIDMTTACYNRHISYENLDLEILDIDTILSYASQQQVGFDLEDVLRNPNFRIRTYGIRKVAVHSAPEVLGSRIHQEIRKLRPYFDPWLFDRFDGDSSSRVIRSPIVIICGPKRVVEDTKKFLDRSLTFQRPMPLWERESEEWQNLQNLNDSTQSTLYKEIIACPLPSAQKIYIVGIYPIDSDWWLKVLRERKEWFLKVLNPKKSMQTGLLRPWADLLRDMITQANYLSLDELLQDGILGEDESLQEEILGDIRKEVNQDKIQ